MSKKRAINAQQKEDRRQTILDSAKTSFESTPYEAISMQQVAGQAGLAKGTLYLYFETKEALFLALLSEELEAWFDEIDALLDRIRAAGEACSPEEFAKLLAYSLEDRPIVIRLIAISQAILERNIDYQTALAFKERLRVRIIGTSTRLASCLHFLNQVQAARLILWVYMLVIGVQSVAEPATVVRNTWDEPGMEIFQIDFYQEIQALLATLLTGLAKDQKEQGEENE